MSMVPEKQQPKASAKIKDVNNQSKLQVKSHQHIRNTAIAEAEASAKPKAQMSISTTATAATALPLAASTSSSSFPSTTKWKQLLTKVLNSDVEAATQPEGKFMFQDLSIYFFQCTLQFLHQKNHAIALSQTMRLRSVLLWSAIKHMLNMWYTFIFHFTLLH